MTSHPQERDTTPEPERGPDPRLRTMTEDEAFAESLERAARRKANPPERSRLRPFTR